MGRQAEHHTVYTVSRGLDLTLERYSLCSFILEARVDGLYYRIRMHPPGMADGVVWELVGEASISEYEVILHNECSICFEHDESLWIRHENNELDGWSKTTAWRFENDSSRYYVDTNMQILDTWFGFERPDEEF